MRTSTEAGLSVRQPWVELILQGRKTIEVRTWTTTHRGPLWLHAGQRVDTHACVPHGVPLEGLSVGALVGTVEVVDCFAFDASTWTSLRHLHMNLVPFEERFVGWVLRNPQRIPPVAFRGTLGLMKIPANTIATKSTHA
jgi:activating signal cointegrator 1